MRASSPLVVLLMAALAALAKASVFGGRKRRGPPGGSAFCYTTPLNRGFFHRPYILRPSGLYKSNDDDASTFPVPDASPTPQSSSPSLSPSSSSSSSTAIFPYVRVEEAAHPLLHRSLSRSFAFFLQRARAIFFPSPCTPSSSPSSRLTPATSPSPAIWPRLREICRPEYPLLTLSTLTLLLAASVEVAVPHFSSQALSAILQQKGQTEFFRAVRRVFELGVLAALSTGVRGLCFGLAGTRIVCRLRHALFKSLLQQDIAFFDRTKSGELTNRLTADCVKISNVVSLNVNILLRQAIQLLGGLLYLHRLHARIALLTAGGMAVIFLVTGAHGRYNRKMAEEIQDTLASSNAVAGTSLSLIRLVRTHVGESTELERYDQALHKTLNNMEAHDFGYGAYRLAVRLAQTGLLTAVLTVGWQLTCSGAMSMDQLTSALFYVQFVMNASFDVSDQYSRIQEALGSATQVFALLDRTPAMSVKPLSPSPSLPTFGPSSRVTSSPPSSSERHGASVVFSNVSFTYPLRPHTPILSSLYLNIGPGQRVAVVGASGGGKSTLLRLLARHYDVDAGSIFLDGRDLLTFSQEELSNKVAMLSQEPPLLPISIKDNIAYGLKPGTFSQADVEAAARAANIYDFVQSLPDRFETVIGEGSVGLSGGEKQRVAIARALMRKPEILLLDEPSSALDQSSQAIVQAALERAAEGRTTLIIAHRLSTIESCDSIIVLKSGAVVERGTHAELLAKEGVYAAFRAQQTFMQPPKDVEPRRAQAVKEAERT